MIRCESMNEDGIVTICSALGLGCGKAYPGSSTWGPHLSISCFLAGTPVLTDIGYVPIEEITVGSRVMTADHGYQRVKAVQFRNYTGDVVSYNVSGLNQTLEATANHRVFSLPKRAVRIATSALTGDCDGISISVKGVIRELGTLGLKDRLRLPLPTQTSSTSELLIDPERYRTNSSMPNGGVRKSKIRIPLTQRLDYDFAYLVGLCVAEGSLNSPGKTKSGRSDTAVLSFRLGEPAVDRCIELVKQELGLTPGVYERVKENGVNIHIHDWLFARWLEEQVGRGAANKRIPAFIFEASDEAASGFIDGLFAGDGHHTFGIQRSGDYKSISTVSKTLRFQLPILLGRLGISCRTTSRAPRVDLDGTKHRRSYEVLWSKSQTNTKGAILDGVCWYPISRCSRRSVSDLPVYNLTVENDESYVVGSIAVKNCPLAPKTHSDPYDGNMSCSVQLVDDGPSGARCFSSKCGFKGKLLRLIKLAVDIRAPSEELTRLLKHVEAVEKLTVEANHTRVMNQINEDVSLTSDVEKLKAFLNKKKQVIEDRDVLSEDKFDLYKGSVPGYAIQRGITIESARRWGLGYDKHLKYLVFPMRRRDGKLVGLIGRSVVENPKRRHHNYMGLDKSRHLFGAQLLKRNKPIVVVEGCIDAIKTEQALDGRACVVASLGEGFSRQHAKTISAAHPTAVYIFTDGDSPGHAMASKIHYALNGHVPMYLMETPWGPIIDANADGTPVRSKVDPAILPPDVIRNLFDTARLIKGQIQWTVPTPVYGEK
jgi:5S rRNA maturation endonuclease (ribonuclease M5)